MSSKSAAIDPVVTLLEAHNGRLNPMDALFGATVRVSLLDMLDTDKVWVHWASRPLGEYKVFGPYDGLVEGIVDVHIPPYFVGLRINRFAEFFCVVQREGDDFRSTEGRIIVTLPFNELAKPQILQAIDESLDLSVLCCKDPEVHVSAWPFIDPVQIVSLQVRGTNADDSSYSGTFFTGEHISDAEVSTGWKRSLPWDTLRGLKHGSQLNLVFLVGFNGDGDSAWRLFPDSTITVLTEPHLELVPASVVEATQVSPEDYVLNPVNAKQGATVRVSYDNMCPCDWVCVNWVGTPGAGSPVLECRYAGEAGEIDFHVAPSAISANFNQQILLDYHVTRCDGSEWTSPSRQVAILGLSGQPRPEVEEVTGNVLSLNTFSGDANATVIPWDYIALNQPCWLWVTGELEDGSPYRFNVLEGEPVTEEWLANGVNTPLPRPELQKLADCSEFKLHFAVNFDGQSDRDTAVKFPVRYLSIEQEDLVLSHPRVREAVNDQLTIWNGRDGVTVRVEYERISPHHMIKVMWIKADGTSLPLASQPGNSDPGYVDFAIPREAVIQGAGKTILIHYIVTSACKMVPSKTLGLKISVPVRLPTPVVPQATPPATQGGLLDLRTFTGDGHITVNDKNFDKAWWFALEGQRAWLRGVGTLKSGGTYTINVFLNKVVSGTEVVAGLAGILKRSDLELLRDASTLTFTCKVTASGSSNESEAVVFPALSLTIRSPMDDFTPFTANNWNRWIAGPSALGEMRYASFFGKTCVANGTASTAAVGNVLYKDFTGLLVGATYEFSILACTYNGAAPMPRLSLRTNAGAVTGIMTFSYMAWTPLRGTFVASNTSMRLEIWSHEPTGISGNDYGITDIRVRG